MGVSFEGSVADGGNLLYVQSLYPMWRLWGTNSRIRLWISSRVSSLTVEKSGRPSVEDGQ